MPALPHAFSFLLGVAATSLFVLFLQRRARKNRNETTRVEQPQVEQYEEPYSVQPAVNDTTVAESPSWESAPEVPKGMWVIGEDKDEEVDVSDEEFEVRPMTGPRLPVTEEEEEEEETPKIQEITEQQTVEEVHEETPEPVSKPPTSNRKVRTRAKKFVPLEEDTVDV